MFKRLLLSCFLVLTFSCAYNREALLRPTLETLQHNKDQKFIHHNGIKKLCETYLGMKYLYKPKIELSSIENKTKNDLKDMDNYIDNESKYGQLIIDNKMADIYVKFMDDEVGYGVFANNDIESGDFIGEFTGVIKKDDDIDDTTWAWSYPSDEYKDELKIPKAAVDAKWQGNGMRFVNHSDNENVGVTRAFVDGFFRTIYYAQKNIKKDSELLVNYGKAYWSHRRKKRNL